MTNSPYATFYRWPATRASPNTAAWSMSPRTLTVSGSSIGRRRAVPGPAGVVEEHAGRDQSAGQRHQRPCRAQAAGVLGQDPHRADERHGSGQSQLAPTLTSKTAAVAREEAGTAARQAGGVAIRAASIQFPVHGMAHELSLADTTPALWLRWLQAWLRRSTPCKLRHDDTLSFRCREPAPHF